MVRRARTSLPCPAVNFLLLAPDELAHDGVAVVRGRRLDHARTVLGVAAGRQLRIGVVDGALGTATVVAVDRAALTLACTFDRAPAPVRDTLLLAVPRPKVLLRMLAHAAALGFARILLCRSWRVEKSHLASTAMQPAAQREQLLLGLEQAGRTRVPTVHFAPLWRPMVEDLLPAFDLPPLRFVGHPAAAARTHELALPRDAAFALALGPDGGFTDYEIGTLAAAGFAAISAGDAPLRTETALAVLAGQLDLLRRCGSVRAE